MHGRYRPRIARYIHHADIIPVILIVFTAATPTIVIMDLSLFDGRWWLVCCLHCCLSLLHEQIRTAAPQCRASLCAWICSICRSRVIPGASCFTTCMRVVSCCFRFRE